MLDYQGYVYTLFPAWLPIQVLQVGRCQSTSTYTAPNLPFGVSCLSSGAASQFGLSGVYFLIKQISRWWGVNGPMSAGMTGAT
jgi:hypothetical protein